MANPAFLLDSNICIYILEGFSEGLRTRVQQCAPGELAASSIVYAEVMRGIDQGHSTALRAAERLFKLVPVLPFDDAAALRYRDVPFRRGSFDRLIAAHALALDLTVVTANTDDFADVPGLRIENWTLP